MAAVTSQVVSTALPPSPLMGPPVGAMAKLPAPALVPLAHIAVNLYVPLARPAVSKPAVSLLGVLTVKVLASGPVTVKVAPGEPEQMAEMLTAVAVTFELTPAYAAAGSSVAPKPAVMTARTIKCKREAINAI